VTTGTGLGSEPLVRLRGLRRRFSEQVIVGPVDLDIFAGDFLAVLGPSGCGKTTLLRMIGGFETPTGGSIEIGGVDVTRKGPEHRKTNTVFQGYGLFPHMTVHQNVAYGLRLARRPVSEIQERVARILDLVRLGDLAGRYPQALSGGQQQRVALARALVMEPDVLLLDESLGALDLNLRRAMQEELRQLHQTIGGTFVFVTHDQGEAMSLATRIVVMQDGRIVQEGTPEHVYRHPASAFVARFIGDANIIDGKRANGHVAIDGAAPFDAPGPDGAVIVIVRPDDMSVLDPDCGVGLSLSGRIVDRVFMGSHVRLLLRLETGQQVVAHKPSREGEAVPAVGEPARVAWQTGACWVLPL